MKKYMVEYTASVTGSMAGRDDGQPYRTTRHGEDKIGMMKFFKECMAGNKRYGWKAPIFFEMDVVECNPDKVLADLAEHELVKHFGGGI